MPTHIVISRKPTKTKVCALRVFRVVRAAMAELRSVPCAVHQAGKDIAEAWQESGSYHR
jgi:hypothetical protein